MSFLATLLSLAHHSQPAGHAAQQSKPDITYNPNQNTNIPYSAHTPQQAQQGNAYTANPTAPQFIGVDPAQFGYPADNSGLLQHLAVQSQHSPLNLGVPYGMNPTGQVLNQGGQYNPGYTPMQGGGGNPQIGAFQDQPGQLNAPRYNPQDSGNYWYQ